MTKKQEKFITTVWDYYSAYGRSHLPWRNAKDPYTVLVSELMLQQTQVDRVIPKFNNFISQWPDVRSLAKASLADVITAWQGLGYNRRAKYLHDTAKLVVLSHNGKFPVDRASLESLPGVGPYTAGAILAFAYNQPVVFIETNIRQVYIHHFFSNQSDVTDSSILDLVEKTLPRDASADWYAALMDYGSYLKKEHGNLTKKSKSYQKQSPFIGSNRAVRGGIIRLLTADSEISEFKLAKQLALPKEVVSEQLKMLSKEGLVERVVPFIKISFS